MKGKAYSVPFLSKVKIVKKMKTIVLNIDR